MEVLADGLLRKKHILYYTVNSELLVCNNTAMNSHAIMIMMVEIEIGIGKIEYRAKGVYSVKMLAFV